MSIKIVQSGEQKDERMKKNEQSFRDQRYSKKCTKKIQNKNLRRRRGEERIFEEIMAENFQNLI